MGLKEWFQTLISGKPHFHIGGTQNPYLLRWYIIPRNRWFNLYLHRFLRDDDDRALHDHPWWFVSCVLAGGYIEYLDNDRSTMRYFPDIRFRRSTHRHRVELFRSAFGRPLPCWTLVITGRTVREWGFWCQQGFVPWHKFVAQDDHGNIGKGCDQ